MEFRIPTYHAPAERYDEDELLRQKEIVHSVPMLEQLLNFVPIPVLVLNDLRQIIFFNRAFLDFVEKLGASDPMGKRPGEALKCINSSREHGGCGTSEFCKTCGAVNSILAAHKGYGKTEECRILISEDIEIEALDLRVWASPFKYDIEELVVFCIQDISDEKRRGVLERIFFHDVSNTAQALLASAVMLQTEPGLEENEEVNQLNQNVESLIDEIKAQKDLVLAENGILQINPEEVLSLQILENVIRSYSHQPVAENIRINIEKRSRDVSFTTDKTLLKRVLSNMLKNALEASNEGETVSCASEKRGDLIRFSIHNSTSIPEVVQLQIFNRSYSTKGVNRGIGTYSMKLLTEKYLRGKLDFISDDNGTTFFIELPDHLL